MSLHWPQVVWMGLVAMMLGVALAKHGQSKGNYNFGVELVAAVLAAGLLWAGGFFG